VPAARKHSEKLSPVKKAQKEKSVFDHETRREAYVNMLVQNLIAADAIFKNVNILLLSARSYGYDVSSILKEAKKEAGTDKVVK
jgi:hypothetical protein